MISLAQIELTYLIIFTLITLIIILAYTNKMTVGIAIMSIVFGSLICYIFAPYMQLVISPVGDYIFYGYSLSFFVISAIAHIISLVIMLIVALYNLLISGGKITWA